MAPSAATVDTPSVHGDSRNGNLIVGPEGVRAVLDWELAHVGDRHEDLGWLCVNSWRFGRMDRPVGGVGARYDLFEGYEEAGGETIDRDAVRWWEVFGSLRWGAMCSGSALGFRTDDPTPERAMIARRTSETEIDLLRLMGCYHAGRAAPGRDTWRRRCLPAHDGDGRDDRAYKFPATRRGQRPDLVARQIELARASDLAEGARLESLLGGQGSLADLNRLLTDRIAAGAIDRATPELLDHLRATTLAKLAVDQPSYSGYLAALDGAQAKDI